MTRHTLRAAFAIVPIVLLLASCLGRLAAGADGAAPTEKEIIDHCRGRMAHFKAPKQVVFGVLPKTSTGKIQKFVLRERAKSTSATAASRRT